MALSAGLKRNLIAFLIFDVVLVVVIFTLYQVRSERESLLSLQTLGVTVYPEVREIYPFSLTDQDGDAFDRDDFKGRWNLVFFGFTSCPDICPLTMTELKQFHARLDTQAQSAVRIIMVSVDPDRDSPAIMASYVNSFNEDFVGLTGDPVAISKLAAQFFVAHSEPKMDTHGGHGDPLPESADYLIEHSGHLGLIDPQGKFYGVIRAPIRDQDLAKAFEIIRDNS